MALEMKLVVLVVLSLVGGALGQLQKAILYDQYNGNGQSIIINENYVANLGDYGFDNQPHSVCVTGIWLFYQDTGFNPNGNRGMEYIYGKDNYCVNIQTIAGYVSSLRYAGHPKDYRTETFTLYEHDDFQGQEEYTANEVPNLTLAGNHKSIIITGDSDWTVYDRPSYQGNSICLQVPSPGTNDPSFLCDLEKLDPVIPHGAIRSVHKGCTGKNTVTLESFARMQAPFVQK